VSARADYYPYYGNYYQRQPAPIISLELNPQKSLDSSFRIAAREGRLEDLRKILAGGAAVNSRSDQGVTALMYAAGGCATPVVEFLLANGADPNLNDSEGRSALIYAVRQSCAEAARDIMRSPSVRLLERDRSGRSALDYAADMAEADVGGTASRIERWLRIAIDERREIHRHVQSSSAPATRTLE
jgi:ankyrin repeat protein